MKIPWRITACGLIVAGGLVLGAPVVRGDAPAWMHAATTVPLPSYDAGTNAVLIYSEDVTTVMPDGRTKSIERRAYKILRPEGREYALAEAYIGHDSKLGSMKAWCIPQQGKDYEVKDKDAVERSAGLEQGELASDLKVRLLRIPAADPGNVVGYEIEYQSRPFVLQDWWPIQREIPIKDARYTLQLPSGWEYKAAWINHTPVEPTPSGSNQWSWSVKDVPAIRHERDMPPMNGLASQMIVSFLAPGSRKQSGFVRWDEMGKWYGELTSGRRDATPEIGQKVVALTQGAATPEQKMQKIADFMQRDIRYVAISFGIGGWQPHAASDVFVHRYGDCKDKATLMSSMLKQVGIDSYYVVINTRRGGVGSSTPPMVFWFNHVILAIKIPQDAKGENRFRATIEDPKLGPLLIFDPTDPKTPFGDLRGDLQANYGLLVTPDGGELLAMPQLPTIRNGLTRNGKFLLDAHGTLKADISEIRKGDHATYERYAQISLPSSKDRVKRIEQEVAHSIGMFEVTSASMTALDATEVPFGYSYSFVAPSYAKQAGDLLVVRPRVMGIESSDLLETKEPRRFPVIFEGPEKNSDTFEITLPGGYAVDDLPPAVDMDYSFASYHSKSEAVGNKLKYTRTFEIKELSVPMEKMDDLRKFYRVIAGDERNTAILKPSTAAAAE
jgi:hypothetical protein